jgi:hypothetical protein
MNDDEMKSKAKENDSKSEADKTDKAQDDTVCPCR